MSSQATTGITVGRKIAAGMLATATFSLASAGIAGASEPTTPLINATQLQCLVGQGINISTITQNLTTEKLATLLAAARACNINIPQALIDEITRHIAGTTPNTTAPPSGLPACLASKHLSLPAAGQLPTAEQIASYKAALVACGVTLPTETHEPTHTDAPATTNNGSGDNGGTKNSTEHKRTVRRVIRKLHRTTRR